MKLGGIITHRRRAIPRGAVLSPSLLEPSVPGAHSLDGRSGSTRVAFYFKIPPEPSPLPTGSEIHPRIGQRYSQSAPTYQKGPQHHCHSQTLPSVGCVLFHQSVFFAAAAFQDTTLGLNMPVNSKCNGGRTCFAAWETHKLRTKRQAVWWWGGKSGVHKLAGVVVRCF